MDATAIDAARTHMEVRQLLGSPTETTPCADGTTVEVFHVNVKRLGELRVPVPCCFGSGVTWRYPSDTQIVVLDVFTFGAYELFLTPSAAYQVARRARYLAFVYAPDGAVSSRSSETTLAEARTRAVLAGLFDAARTLVDRADCPRWQPCLAAEVAATRRHAACMNYTLPDYEELGLRYLLSVAHAVDEGRLTAEAGQAELRVCAANYTVPFRLCPSDFHPAPPRPPGGDYD